MDTCIIKQVTENQFWVAGMSFVTQKFVKHFTICDARLKNKYHGQYQRYIDACYDMNGDFHCTFANMHVYIINL